MASKTPQTPQTERTVEMTIFAALDFLNAGFSVFPIEYQSKQPMMKWSLLQDHQAQPEMVSRWFSLPANLGIITGYNNLLVLDFDSLTEYTRWLGWIGKQPIYSLAKRAFAVRTSRGVHVYFRSAQPERNRHIDKIDVKARFGYVVGPGSVHPSGATYTPLHGDFFIPTIANLSDVLPASLLLSKLDVSPVIVPPQPLAADSSSDVWQSANAMAAGAPGEDLITAIRKKFKIEDFFTTPMIKSGGYFVVTKCPFHSDDHPSFWIDQHHQVCGCFTCNFGKPWDVINLVSQLYGISNYEAIFFLAKGL
jgi:hypothetical protein